MAGRKDIEAGAAYIRLYVQKSQLLSGLSAGIKDVAKFAATAAAGVAAIGTAATTAAVAAINHFASSGDEINKMSERTGASVEALSELRYAAGQSGAGIEDLEAAMRAMAKNGGSGDPVENLEAMADRLASIEDPGERARVAMEEMGKGGAKLLPLMLGGAEGIRELRQEARDLGQSFDKTAADNATAFGDAWDRVKAVMSGAAFTIGGALAPGATNLLDIVKNVAVAISGWVKQNAGLLSSFTDITGALAADNFALVGQAAMEALNLAILEGIAKISAMLGEGWGDIFAVFATGDLEGKWNLAIGAMGVTWDAFVSSVVDAFSAAADAIVSAWKTATSFISDTIIENHKLLKDVIKLTTKFSGAGLLVDENAVSEAVLGPDIRQQDAAQAKDIARESIGSTASSIQAAIEANRASVAGRAAASAAAFGESVAGGRTAAADAAAASRTELGRLMEQIKSAAASRVASPNKADEPIVAPSSAATVGTFSAAAAVAAGGSGGIQERIARGTEKTNKILEKSQEISLQLMFAMTGLAGSLKHS